MRDGLALAWRPVAGLAYVTTMGSPLGPPPSMLEAIMDRWPMLVGLAGSITGRKPCQQLVHSTSSSGPHLREQLADEGERGGEVAGLQLQRHQPCLDALAKEGALLRRRPLHLLPAHVQLHDRRRKQGGFRRVAT